MFQTRLRRKFGDWKTKSTFIAFFASYCNHYATVVSSRPYYCDLGVLCLIIVTFSSSWLQRTLPSDDFPGNVSLLWFFRSALESGHFPFWCKTWFCGFPVTLLWSKFFSYLFCLPFAGAFGDILGLKFALLVGHMFAAASMYFLLLFLLSHQNAACIGALFYCIHPIYLAETALRGHLEVSLFFAIVPLVFLVVWKAVLVPQKKTVLLASLVCVLGIWTNNEGAVSTYPFLCIPFLIRFFELWRQGYPLLGLNMRKIAIAGVIMICLIFFLAAFFLLPALFETVHLNFFEQSYLEKSLEQFSLKNVFYLFNRSNRIFESFPDAFSHETTAFGGAFYVGFSGLLLCLLYLFRPPSRQDFLFGAGASIFTVTFLLGLGPYSFHETGQLLFTTRGIEKETASFLAIYLTGIPTFILFILFFSRRVRSFFLTIFFSMVLAVGLLFVKFQPLLCSLIPLYAHSRSPQWFFISMAPFSLALMTAIAFQSFSEIRSNKVTTSIFFIVVSIIVVFDFKPYTTYFSHMEPRARIEAFEKAYEFIASQPGDMRTMTIESYDPLFDLGPLYSSKSAAWYWLNWTCTRWTADIVYRGIMPSLWRGDNSRAMKLASVGNIHFITDDSVSPGNVNNGDELVTVFNNRFFTIYKNPLAGQFLQVYPRCGVYLGTDLNQKLSLIAFLTSQHIALIDMDGDVIVQNKEFVDFVFWDKTIAPDAVYDELKQTFKNRFFDMSKGDPISTTESALPRVQARWKRPSDQQIVLTIEVTEPLFVELAESFHPRWHAQEGENILALHKTNHAFLGFQVRPGHHEIVFSYSPGWPMIAGCCMTLLTVFGIVFSFFMQRAAFRKENNG